ncbi:MAG: response regulator transcription factor [Bacteroidia bacterium]|nr:response regulator transcription factor [Bacteroidia bacterium]
MKILIIEDESLVAVDLKNQILRLDPHAQVLGVISSVRAAKEWFTNNNPPDLILSDIRLSDGNSFEIFESLRIHCPIIFTTAYDEYAIRAFKLNSVDYLLKPVDIKELESAFLKYKSLNVENVLEEQLKALMSQFKGSEKRYKERFLGLHLNTLIPVNQHEIALFHKTELIHMYTVGHEKLISEHQTLDEIEGLLDPDHFFRANRQFIIHRQSVGRVKTTHKGLTVAIKPPNVMEVDISREKAAQFKQWLG